MKETSNLDINNISVDLIRSRRRKKTMQATFNKETNTLVVRAPYYINDYNLQKFVTNCIKNLENKIKNRLDESKLYDRAKTLLKKYFENKQKFNTISYSSRLKSVWGKCYTQRKDIVLNPILKTFPEWVEDYVIIHELAHLFVAGHGKEFKELVDRYPLKERALGYLMAKSENLGDIDLWQE